MTLTTADLQDFVPAIVTPFREDGAIDYDAFLVIADHLLARGATAICVAGDNGESWALSAAERGRRGRLLADRSVPVILGVSAPTLGAALAHTEAGHENGAQALLGMPPTYVLKGSEAEVARRFEALAGTGLPLVLYNSPRRAGHSLAVPQIAALAESLPVIGIKESHRDFFHHTHLLHALADRVSVMTGPCHYILPSLALGARGFIATGPELIPERPADLPAMAMAPGPASRAAHARLTGVYEALMGLGTWPAVLKCALRLAGLPAGVPRDPVLLLGPADADRLRAVMDWLGLPRPERAA